MNQAALLRGGNPAPTVNRGKLLHYRFPNGASIWSFSNIQTSHLIVHRGESVLIDCHDAAIAVWIDELSLPVPKRILHTHVQPSNCREGSAFLGATIFVHEKDALLAFEPSAVRASVQNQRADLKNWGTQFGREPFGIAGCQTAFPPTEQLPRGGVFLAGSRIPLIDLYLEVVALPFHERNAVGFVLSDSEDRAMAVFPGDLLHNEAGFIVDYHSAQENYIANRIENLPGLLESVASIGDVPLFPTTGLPIKQGVRTIRRLRDRVLRYLAAKDWNPFPAIIRPPVLRTIGRFQEIFPGVFNMTNFGNTVVLIGNDGHGLVVDPGPCDYDNTFRDLALIEDLRLLEQHAGLQNVDLALLTHFHGDHVDGVHLVRQRYPLCRVATWFPVAEVLSHPENFNYSAMLPWYGLGQKKVEIDVQLPLGRTLSWQGSQIETLHLPGHALAHTGFLIPFRNRLLSLSGDTVQTNGEADALSLVPTNYSAPDDAAGPSGAYRRLSQYPIDLNVGGHGSWFPHCKTVYNNSLQRIEKTQQVLLELFEPGSLKSAFIPHWLPNATDSDHARDVNSSALPIAG